MRLKCCSWNAPISKSLFQDDAGLLMDFLFGTKQGYSSANRRVDSQLGCPSRLVFVYIVTFHAAPWIIQTVILTLDTSANNDQHRQRHPLTWFVYVRATSRQCQHC